MAESTPSTTLRSRRNLRWIVAGILAISLGVLGAAMLYLNLSSATAVVAIKHTVYREQVITAADLGITSVASVAGMETVAADRIDDVIGHTARMDLTEGTLLSPRAYGESEIAAGSVRLGVRLAAGRLPASALPPGTPVLLVPVGRDGAEPPAGGSISARVATSPQLQADGAAVLDVTTAEADAERTARLAAADQLALVRLAEPGR